MDVAIMHGRRIPSSSPRGERKHEVKGSEGQVSKVRSIVLQHHALEGTYRLISTRFHLEFAHANKNSVAKPYLSLAPGFLH